MSERQIFAFVGLGNPGAKYAYTRHNVGFRALDAILERVSGASASYDQKFQGDFKKISLNAQQDLYFLKPMTFMNLSGKSVQGMMTFFKLKPEQIFVFHDDIDIALGRIRIKKAGGAGGHNGLKSIDQSVGNQYWRVRIGVDKAPPPVPTEAYVLQNFLKEEEVLVEKILSCLAENFELLISHGHDKLMNRISLCIDKP